MVAAGGGKDKADNAADYGRDRARSAQDRFNRGYENTPSGGDIRREGEHHLVPVLVLSPLNVPSVAACLRLL